MKIRSRGARLGLRRALVGLRSYESGSNLLRLTLFVATSNVNLISFNLDSYE